MRLLSCFKTANLCRIALLLTGFFLSSTAAAQLSLKDVVIYGGSSTCPTGITAPTAPGCGVSISASAVINSGAIVTHNLVKSGSGVTINGSIHSGGTIELGNENIIGGFVTVANRAKVTTALQVANNSQLQKDLNVNGSVNVGTSRIVSPATLTIPRDATYTGPRLGNRLIYGTPTTPALPGLPIPKEFSAGSTDITGSNKITPGAYGNITLNGGKTLIFDGPGEYFINAIKNTGSVNKFVFDFTKDNNGYINYTSQRMPSLANRR